MKIGDITLQNQSDQLPIPYVDVIIKDLSTGSGTQAITGIGFKPSWIIFFGIVINTDFASWGAGTINQRRAMIHRSGVDNFGSTGGLNAGMIRFTDINTNDDITATITSMDTDGFTLTWTVELGSPTGSGRIIFMAFK